MNLTSKILFLKPRPQISDLSLIRTLELHGAERLFNLHGMKLVSYFFSMISFCLDWKKQIEIRQISSENSWKFWSQNTNEVNEVSNTIKHSNFTERQYLKKILFYLGINGVTTICSMKKNKKRFWFISLWCSLLKMQSLFGL